MKAKFLLSYRTQSKLFPYFLMIPTLIPIAVILLYPIFRTAYMSLFDISTMKPDEGVFVGFQNYAEILVDKKVIQSLKNTAFVTVFTVCCSVLLGLLLALALNRNMPMRGFFRSLIIVPWATPAVAAVLVWTWMMNSNFGLLNYLLSQLGLITKNIGFLTNKKWAMFSLCLVMTWKYFSISCLMLLSGLQSIDTTMYEAAKVDGASPFAQFLNVTLPGLKSSATVLILLVTVWSFREFTTVRLLTNGGPARSTETMVLTTYLSAFSYYKLGFASAMGIVTFLLSMVFSILYFMIIRKGDD